MKLANACCKHALWILCFLVGPSFPIPPAADSYSSSLPAPTAESQSLVQATALTPEMAEGDEDREKWQRVPEVLAALGVKEGSSVADVGSGEGFFTLRLARAVGPSGRVFAIDIDKKPLGVLKKRLRKGGFKNVQVVRANPDDPKLPPGSIDAALFVASYHEMKSHQAILEHVRCALKHEGRIVVLEHLSHWESLPLEEESREKQERQHELDIKFVSQDLEDARFEVIARQKAFFRSVSEFSMTAARLAR